MKSQVLHAASYSQLKSQLTNSAIVSIQPNLAVIFTSIKHETAPIIDLMNDLNIDVVGCTTAGEITNQNLHEHSIAVLLLEVDKSFYEIKHAFYPSDGVYESALRLGKFSTESFESPGMLIVSGGLAIDANQLIEGIKKGVGREIPIYGGLAGDDLNLQQTSAFTNEGPIESGVAAIIWDLDKIDMQGLATSGWEPVGMVNTITQAKGNVIYGINGEPAFEVFSRYFGFSKDNTASDKLITIQTNYPFQIIRDGGYNILRSPLLVNPEEGTLTLASSVEEGTKFRFSNSPGFEVIEQTIEEFEQLKTNAPSADALIMFSCKGRHGAFGPMLEDEIEGIYEYWQSPLIGFLSYGEFGNTASGICEFHNETCSLVVLKEK